jgi:hypothetical protein
MTDMYYLHHPYYTHPPIYHNGYYRDLRQTPPVDASLLYQSANESKKLMQDASKVLNHLAISKEFDAELMYAAQISDIKEVTRLINSIGVTSKVEININPDGLRLEFTSTVEPLDCCRLYIALRWR